MRARKSEKRKCFSVLFSHGNAAQARARFVSSLDYDSSSSDKSAALDWLGSSSESEFHSDCDKGPHSEQVNCVENVEHDKYFVFHVICFKLSGHREPDVEMRHCWLPRISNAYTSGVSWSWPALNHHEREHNHD